MIYLKTRPAWSQLLIFIGMAFGIFMVLSLIGVLILSRITGIPLEQISGGGQWDFSNPAMLTFVRGLLLVQFLGLFLIPTFLFAYFSDPKPMNYLGFNRSSPVYLLLGVAALFVAIPLVEWSGVINHQLIPETTSLGKWMKESEDSAAQQITFMLKRNSLQDLLLNLLFIAVFAGIGEELLFRGVLQRILIKIFKNPWLGIILTAVVFSAIHLQFYGFIPRLILGIILGLIYWYSGSLWPAILAHFAYDAFFIVMVYLNPALADDQSNTITPGSPVFMALFSAAALVYLIWIMKKRSTASYEKVYAGDTMENSNPFSL